VAVLEAFFDESGTHAKSTIVVVAGALAKQDDWIVIMQEWLSTLSEFDVPFFHASELAAFQGPFKDWREPRRRQFLSDLIDILNDHDVIYVTVGVNRALYENVRQEFRNVDLGPYGFCCMCAVGEVIQYVNKANLGTVAVVFGAGQKFESQPSTVGLRDELEHPGVKDYYKLDSLTQATTVNARQLEIADLIAYESYRNLDNNTKNQVRKPRKSLIRLLERNPLAGGLMTEEGIRFYLENFTVLWAP